MVVQKFEALYTGTVGRLLRPLPLSVGVADGPSGSQRILAVAEWSPDDKVKGLHEVSLNVAIEETRARKGSERCQCAGRSYKLLRLRAAAHPPR